MPTKASGFLTTDGRASDLVNNSHIESVDGHDVEVAELRGGDGEIRGNSIALVDHEAGDAPTPLHSQRLQIFGDVGLEIQLINDVEVTYRK